MGDHIGIVGFLNLEVVLAQGGLAGAYVKSFWGARGKVILKLSY